MTNSVLEVLASVLLRSSAVIVVAWIATRLVTVASVRHALWTGATLAALVLPIGVMTLPNATISVPAAASDWWDASGQELMQAVSTPLVASRSEGAPGVLTSPRENSSSPVSWSAIFLVTWLAGALVLLLRVFASARAADRIVRRAHATPHLHLAELANDIAARKGWTMGIRLLESDDLTAPATVGCFSPSILLPATAASWDRERAHAVLTHELAHTARRDCLTQMLAQVTCAVYWMNPLVWTAERRMEIERERACDDEVLASGVRSTSYAEALVEMVQSSVRPRQAVLSMAEASHLEARVIRILNGENRGELSRRSRAAIVFGALFVVLALTVLNPETAHARAKRVVATLMSPEPDLLGDSVAHPRSERVPLSGGVNPRLVSAALAGPDSLLARALVRSLDRVPSWEGDLVRERATWALSRTESGRLVEPLIDALDDPDWRIRAYAAWALGPARDPRAVPGLIRGLDHPVWRVRAAAAHALRDSDDPRALDAMVRALEDPAWQVRSSAVSYVAGVGGKSSEALVRARLDDRHVAVRDAAHAAISKQIPTR